MSILDRSEALLGMQVSELHLLWPPPCLVTLTLNTPDLTSASTGRCRRPKQLQRAPGQRLQRHHGKLAQASVDPDSVRMLTATLQRDRARSAVLDPRFNR